MAPGSAYSAASELNDVHTEEAVVAHAGLNDLADRIESADALTVALGSAVLRCRRLIDQLADLCEQRTVVEGEGDTRPAESVARSERPRDLN